MTTGEGDKMICRACGNEERASEGSPCDHCGTFICQICVMRGVVLCASCQAIEDAKLEADES
jgi:late competence protein required for DNA uptake (superfamily II DNA/RNA helicase)